MKQSKFLLLCLLILMGLTACQSEPETTNEDLIEEVSEAVTETAVSTPTTIPPTSTTIPATPQPTPNPLYIGSNNYPWWNDTIFYEVFVRSFYDSDGDGVGDINGLIQQLDYLNDGDPNTTDDLGITGLWLMPIMESPSYHGYDVVDYYMVDEEYGTNEDFKRLMEEAHQRGIRVVVDLVLNHTGRDHEWFQASRDPESEFRDWYVWTDENPGFRGPEGQPVWHRTPTGYYYALFWDGMPDLNYENPAVTQEMYEVSRYWLEELGVDGFRLDAIKFIREDGPLLENINPTHEWLAEYYTFYKSINPNAFTVGEAWTSTQQAVKYVGDEVDIVFEFDMALAALNSADSRFARQISQAQANTLNSYPNYQFATFLTNHDQNRVMSVLDGDEAKAKVAASWLLTTPGVPFIYYGEEIGMQGRKPDEDIRRPMQWTSDSFKVGFTEGVPWRAPFEDYETRSVALQQDAENSLLNHYRTLIHLRNTHPALRTGSFTFVETDSSRVLAFLRETEEEKLLIVINFDDEPVDNYVLSLTEGTLNSGQPISLFGDASLAELVTNSTGGFDAYLPLAELPAQSTLIIQLP